MNLTRFFLTFIIFTFSLAGAEAKGVCEMSQPPILVPPIIAKADPLAIQIAREVREIQLQDESDRERKGCPYSPEQVAANEAYFQEQMRGTSDAGAEPTGAIKSKSCQIKENIEKCLYTQAECQPGYYGASGANEQECTSVVTSLCQELCGNPRFPDPRRVCSCGPVVFTN